MESRIIDPSSPQDAQPVNEETTKGGIIVPKGTIEKKRRVITKDRWKMWRRAVRSMMDLGIVIGPIHHGDEQDEGCNESLVPKENELALECGCSIWIIER